jgi:hypothetical protein
MLSRTRLEIIANFSYYTVLFIGFKWLNKILTSFKKYYYNFEDLNLFLKRLFHESKVNAENVY